MLFRSALKRELELRYGCPVIDLYSSTETGPVAFSHPDGDGMLILPHDLYVEIVDSDGMPLRPGEHGEICVSGGRNPYLPLLRYRTGDYASIASDSMGRPCLYGLQAREPVSFVADDGAVISMIDVSRIIREWPLVQHEFRQNSDLSCDLIIQPVPGYEINVEEMKMRFSELFGGGIRVSIEVLEQFGAERPGGKVISFSGIME